ncbi:hypothetical protein IE81DRAFT_319374 [Ceraceosorus guamensis]|uniref:Uncharacterized protein n=1 Tax=Ceraceosorus guamensis TaxID=1522189 RepID=A0A316W7Y4_9BASI|nr:hypothetical protein IE81DRAFT_319374 [Ceraceosorus guamensis]PWN46007.1 hypothetical protein IE81DRAFT_319374 [Ceraceosorus guamensis]
MPAHAISQATGSLHADLITWRSDQILDHRATAQAAHRAASNHDSSRGASGQQKSSEPTLVSSGALERRHLVSTMSGSTAQQQGQGQQDMAVGGPSLLSLPPELLHHTFSLLLPESPTSIHPAPEMTAVSPVRRVLSFGAPSANRPFLALSLVCKSLNEIVTPFIYATASLDRVRQARLLARTMLTSPRAQELSLLIKHLNIPSDGILTATDSLADQQAWPSSLDTIFRCTRDLQSLWLGMRPTNIAFEQLSKSSGVAIEPKRVSLNSFSYHANEPATRSLPALREVTHLHLIKMHFDPALVQLPIGSSEGGPDGHVPRARDHTLTLADSAARLAASSSKLAQLRLSQVPADGLCNFAVKCANLYLPEQSRRRLRVSKRVNDFQESLVQLARCSAKMPSFGRLLIELGELGALDEPIWAQREMRHIQGWETGSRSSSPATRGLTQPHIEQMSDTNPGVLASLDLPANIALTDAEGAAQEQQQTEEEAELERDRTAYRDTYWMDVREGKEALVELFRQQRSSVRDASGSALPDLEVRVVAPRPGGWDRHEARNEFLASAAACHVRTHAPSHRSSGSEPIEASFAASSSAADDDQTCFSDPDVFRLAEVRPWLGYAATTACRRSSMTQFRTLSTSTDMRREGSANSNNHYPLATQRRWWTGELPRMNSAEPQAPPVDGTQVI